LEEEGVAVLGTVTTRSEPSPASPAISNAVVLAPSPLEPALEAVMVDSDNLIAELILRHLGSLEGAPTTEGGLAVLDATLAEAGISAAEYDFSDGSGLSIYNRITPAATLRFLLWTQRQPWGEHFLATFPTGGRDGTLEQRFTGTSLEGRIRAKTGTLFGANTLSGFLDTSRGDTLAFSVMVNDRDAEAGSAREEIDAVLLAIAAEN
ncbi:MAG: D-alanyl-D-alanine carboxypeptidase/D-alanyl-D-alanine-endopeptidase, partial [Pseudomonadota bacterium]